MIGWLFVWVYGISTVMLFNAKSIFYTINQFYFKQFSLAWVHRLSVKNSFILSYLVEQFSLALVQFQCQKQFYFKQFSFT